VSASHDRKFFDTFLLILGILVGIAIALIVVARIIAANTSVAARQDDPMYEQQVEARIHPFARDAVAGEDNAALVVPTAEPTTATDLPAETVFQQGCIACHGAGIAGAPKLGDKAAWAPRIAQGKDVLYQHALQGFQGKNGVMPAKGGRADFTDQSVMNAVDYMVAAAQ
jgi:cytochrome c5